MVTEFLFRRLDGRGGLFTAQEIVRAIKVNALCVGSVGFKLIELAEYFFADAGIRGSGGLLQHNLHLGQFPSFQAQQFV